MLHIIPNNMSYRYRPTGFLKRILLNIIYLPKYLGEIYRPNFHSMSLSYVYMPNTAIYFRYNYTELQCLDNHVWVGMLYKAGTVYLTSIFVNHTI